MADSYPKFTVAAVQAASVLFDREQTIDKAVRLIEAAADKGAVIIGFPELFIAGHPNIWFEAKKGNPLPIQGQMFKTYVKNSVKVPSPATDRLCAAAKKAHAYVVMGISEVDSLFPGTIYISQLFISSSGEIMGVHRKLTTTTVEKLMFSPGDGSYLNVYDTIYGRLSALNCGEHTHDLYKYTLLAMGTQIHVASWPSFPDNLYGKIHRDPVEFRPRQFAHEGKLFVVNSCTICDKQNIDFCCDSPEMKNNLVEDSGGSSSIIGPNGEYLAGPVSNGEAIVTAEISLEDAFPGKQVQNVLGHYTRFDVFSLNFNRERLTPFKNVPQDNSGNLSRELGEVKRQLRAINERLGRLTGESPGR